MTFPNDVYWILGIPALSIPLIIHLLYRRRLVPLPFTAVSMLRRAAGTRSRSSRFRHAILLAMRTALIAMVTLVFLKPARLFLPAGKLEGRRQLLVMLDGSASMDLRAEALTPFQRAKADGLRALGSLGPGDLADLIIVRAEPRRSFPDFTENLEAVRNDLRGAEVSPERGNWKLALEAASEILASSFHGAREVWILSDFQRTNWGDADFSRIPIDAQVIFRDFGIPGARNTGIRAVDIDPPEPSAGARATLSWRIASYGPEPATIPVKVKLSGTTNPAGTMELAPYAVDRGSVTIPRLPRAGILAGSIMMTRSDDLPADDERHFIIHVGREAEVLIISDDDDASGRPYLERGFRPEDDPDVPGPFRPRVLPSTAVAGADLDRADLVVLAGPIFPPEDLLESLASRLKAGGTILYFLGGETDRITLDRLGQAAGEGLPEVGRTIVSPGERIGPPDPRDPMLAALSGTWPEIRARSYFEIRPSGAQTLIALEDGTPMLLRARAASGTVVISNISPAPERCDIARRRIFPALLHEIALALRPRQMGRRGFHAGDPVRIAMPGPRRGVRIIDPSGNEVAVAIAEVGGSLSVDLGRLRETGSYSIERNGVGVDGLVVNIDPDEGDPRPIDPQELAGALHAVRVGGETSVGDIERGKPLWQWFALAALALGVGEVLVGRFFRHR